MHYVDCGSVDSTGISIILYKAEVRWYRLSLSVLRRTSYNRYCMSVLHSKNSHVTMT